jgi:uncharacterized 2Fe-2S/4Fe-4S cluster protein (DUF4445 family)
MKAQSVKVIFQPAGKSVAVLPGTELLEAAGLAGFALQTPCGGGGTCGKCRVRIAAGECEGGTTALSESQLAAGFRLACKAVVTGPITVEIPPESLLETEQQILVMDAGGKAVLDPAIRKLAFACKPPSDHDAVSDVERLQGAVGQVEIPYRLLRELPGFMRTNQWRGTAVLAGNRLIALEPGDTSKAVFGVAFDIGTTTIVGTLFDLATGEERAVAAMMNPQVRFGDDVIARIGRIREDAAGLAALQKAVIDAVNSIIATVCRDAGIAKDGIYEVVLAGNTTMQQILCGLDPSALGEMPFSPVFTDMLTLPAADLGIAVNPSADVVVFPQVGGFVGGDTVAGMVATAIDRQAGAILLVDIGTNGEIALAHNGKIMATSAAAGPAFEGARITQGMRAAAGAIEKVMVAEDITCNVIGGIKPIGICGTALIDAVAGLLRAGVIDQSGRILPKAELAPTVPPALADRLVAEANGQVNVILTSQEDSGLPGPIMLWQKDVRELQLAMGAIRAGINILLRRVGITENEIAAVLLAGAFGNYIRRENAQRIGLLPQIPLERIHFVGNAASLGAKMALLSVKERDYAIALQKRTEHMDLSMDLEFQEEFGMAMFFPE